MISPGVYVAHDHLEPARIPTPASASCRSNAPADDASHGEPRTSPRPAAHTLNFVERTRRLRRGGSRRPPTPTATRLRRMRRHRASTGLSHHERDQPGRRRHPMELALRSADATTLITITVTATTRGVRRTTADRCRRWSRSRATACPKGIITNAACRRPTTTVRRRSTTRAGTGGRSSAFRIRRLGPAAAGPHRGAVLTLNVDTRPEPDLHRPDRDRTDGRPGLDVRPGMTTGAGVLVDLRERRGSGPVVWKWTGTMWIGYVSSPTAPAATKTNVHRLGPGDVALRRLQRGGDASRLD